MSHTEEFNRIMQANKPQKKVKTMPDRIEARENMTPLQESLSKCYLRGDTLILPRPDECVLENYQEVRTALINAGGDYNRNTFVFPNDAKPYIDRLMGGESVNIKKEFQFFATPPHLASIIIDFADLNNAYLKVLEPSAGQAALIEAIPDGALNYPVDYCEIMDVNRSVIEKKIDNGLRAICVGNDFLGVGGSYRWDRIIANPPFNKNQDIYHIRKMYEVCKTGGRIVTIASNSWRTGSQKKQIAFREWLNEVGAEVQDIDKGEFKESGTMVSACIIIINKEAQHEI